MKYIQITFFSVLLFSFSLNAQPPRLLITTDIGGDPDDRQSLVRLMVYANEFDMEGIVTSASGTPGELKEALVRPDLVKEIIHGYQAVYSNLLKHDTHFPAPEYLLSVVKKGNPLRGWENVGQGHDTEGSEWIIQMVDKNDPRPLNICIFGGQTDLAQALWKAKNNRSAREYNQFLAKIRVYDINDQDQIFEQIYAEHKLPFYILAKASKGVDKREGAYRGIYLGGNENLTSLEWLRENVLKNHGALGRLYPTKTWTAPNPNGAMKEGDTPAWFYFLGNGLNVPEQPELGGWGGRFMKDKTGVYRDAADTYHGKTEARATVYRWREDFQNDWAARMDWCVRNYNNCNHAPVILINHSKKQTPIYIKAKTGDKFVLDTSQSSDPDGHKLSFEWFVYSENDAPKNRYSMETFDDKTQITVTEMNENESIPLVLKVSDSGNPILCSYKRIIIEKK